MVELVISQAIRSFLVGLVVKLPITIESLIIKTWCRMYQCTKGTHITTENGNCICILCMLLELQHVHGYSVDVAPKKSECFIIVATKGTHCSGSFEILSENSAPIQVMVKGPPPMKAVLFDAKFHGEGGLDPSETEGSFSFKADYDGDHKMCIMNGM